MNQQKMLDLTMQVRQNQTELKDFLSEMDSWENEIKRKEDNLRKSQSAETTADLPPVRNSVFKKKTKKKVKEKPNTGKTNRISGRDFRAWDKYDVDEALQEIDDSKSPSSSEYETDEEWEVERKKQQAIMLKDEGNDFFKEGRFVEAINCYTKGLQCDPTNAILFANRAMALLKQEKYAAAEVDCTDALVIDPTYVKAYSRRASARQKLEKFEEAKSDFLKVLSLDSSNKMAKNELEKIEKILHPPEPEAEGIVFPIIKAPSERSRKPLKRMEIDEVGQDDESKQKVLTTVGHSEVTQKIVEKDSQQFETFVKLVKPSESHNGVEADAGMNSKQTISPNASGCPSDTRKSKESGSSKESFSPRQPTSPRMGIPQNSFQFQADWKILKNDPAALSIYLQKIPPPTYPKLIGESLEVGVLLSLLKCLKEFSACFTDIFAHIKYLSCVKRFAMTVMFLSNTEKQVVRDLFSVVEKLESVDQGELTKLKKIYQL